MICVRQYAEKDGPMLRKLFYNTIRNVCIADYSQQQVEAWANDDVDLQKWCDKLKGNKPFVALLDDEIVGYGDVQDDGYIDHFFCHHMHQGKGIGKSLMQHIFLSGKQKSVSRFYSHVSKTARPFFEHNGFVMVTEQRVEIRGQYLTNYVMEKVVS